VHKAEVGWSSAAIEEEGLKRSLNELIAEGLQVSGVVSCDQNSSTTKMTEDKFPGLRFLTISFTLSTR